MGLQVGGLHRASLWFHTMKLMSLDYLTLINMSTRNCATPPAAGYIVAVQTKEGLDIRAREE
jgi:hypothetical protein